MRRSFPTAMSARRTMPPPTFPAAQQGDELTVEFTVLGRPFVGLNGGPNFKPNEAVSFMVLTEDQEETDRYWNAITQNGGEESACGWCKDRWGFSWQITPRVLLEADERARTSRGQARVRGDDDDEEDRHRHDRSRGRGRAGQCVSSPAPSSCRSTASCRRRAGRTRTRPAASASAAGRSPSGTRADRPVRRGHHGRVRPAARQADLRHLRRLLAEQPGQSDRREIPAHQQICADPFGRAAGAGRTATSSPATRPRRSPSSSKAKAATCSSRAAARSILPLLSAGLIDRLILMTFPVVLGEGKRSSTVGSARRAEAGRAFVSDKGVVFTIYEPAGEVQTGTFATKDRARRSSSCARRSRKAPGEPRTLRAPVLRPTRQKVLIALWADGTPFEYRMLDQEHPENFAELKRALAVRQVPAAARRRRAGDRDDAASSSICRRIIPGPNRWIPDGELGRRVRFLDRFFDLYVMDNMQQVGRPTRCVPKARATPIGVEQGARAACTSPTTGSKPIWRRRRGRRASSSRSPTAPRRRRCSTPTGSRRSAPARPKLAAYRARLLAHPIVARAVDEGRPYRALFPARRARPRLSESGGLPQQLIGLDHSPSARFVAAVAAVLVGVIAADQRRIALAQRVAVGVLAEPEHRQRAAARAC